jgi:uncharacterized protein (DUF1330 family)
MTEPAPAYAIAYLRDVTFGDDIIRYLREIDDTLKPYGGEYLVHGGRSTLARASGTAIW